MGRIVTTPGVMDGKPCVKGTRLFVEHLVRYLAAGDSIADVLESYTFLEHADVLAALARAVM